MYLLVSGFVLSLLLAMGASAWFTNRLEVASDLWQWSPGLLSLLGALGANIPNYVAAIVATIDGQAIVGLGIIIGSNIYNIAIILGVSTFASPGRHGIILSRQEAADARLVGLFTLAIMLSVELVVGCLSWEIALHAAHQTTQFTNIALIIINAMILGLFGVLSFHALQRKPRAVADSPKKGHITIHLDQATDNRWLITRLLGELIIALGIALSAVIVMVQTGQAIAVDIHLPSAILSLLILAVATSLPNTVVAFTLARTGRASASVEEIFSSNSVNAVLGIAVPLLLWSSMQADRLLVLLDGPLMVLLTAIALLCLFKRRVSRPIGLLLILIYVGWIAIHLLL